MPARPGQSDRPCRLSRKKPLNPLFTCTAPRRAFVLSFAILLLLLFFLPRQPSPYHTMPDFARTPLPPPAPFDSEPLFVPPLRTSGRYILDSTHARFKLRSVNWYGASDEKFVPSGLDVRHRGAIAKTIRSMGFNSVRLPFSGEMARDNPLISDYHLSANKDLLGKSAIEIFTAVVEALTEQGLAVIVNFHITRASWYSGLTLCEASWCNSWLGPFCKVSQTEEQWIERWETVMKPLLSNTHVVGVDLRNEPRGLWGMMSWNIWASAAEKAAERLLKLNPNLLIVVEGTSSANDLSGAKDRPIVLSVPDRVVYSSHVFAWSGWGQFRQYSGTSFKQFRAAMMRNWGFLLEQSIAPVWVAEMGAGIGGDEGELNYWTNLIEFMILVDADWGYWAINPRKPKGSEVETWRLVEDDWETVVKDYRMEGLKRIMGQRPLRKTETPTEAVMITAGPEAELIKD